MREVLILSIGIIFINNIVLQSFLGLCPFIGTSKKNENILGLGLAVTFITTLSSIFTYLIYHYILYPLNLSFLKIIVFMLINVTLVQSIDIIIKKTIPALYNFAGIHLPLLSANCIVLGIAVINIERNYTFISSMINGLAGGLGFLMVSFIMAAIREKLELSNLPESFKGIPSALISAGLMALAFMAFDKTMLVFLDKLF
jgi:electron transport complex protein RnfA